MIRVEDQRTETAFRLYGGHRGFRAGIKMKSDKTCKVNIGEPVSIGHAEGLASRLLLFDGAMSPAGHRLEAGVCDVVNYVLLAFSKLTDFTGLQVYRQVSAAAPTIGNSP